MSWEWLPAEVRLLILQTIVTNQRADGDTLASCAAVCREWQMIVEEETFTTLDINSGSIGRFDKYFRDCPRRQNYLKRLRFQVKLPNYHRRLRPRAQTPEGEEADRAAFSGAVIRLFGILAPWDSSRGGLSLELGAFCPSDGDNMCGKKGLLANGQEKYLDLDVDFFEDAISDGSEFYGLPEVEVVTEFSVLRRNCRRISYQTLLDIILSLPRLGRIHLEPWHRPCEGTQEQSDYGTFWE